MQSVPRTNRHFNIALGPPAVLLLAHQANVLEVEEEVIWLQDFPDQQFKAALGGLELVALVFELLDAVARMTLETTKSTSMSWKPISTSATKAVR